MINLKICFSLLIIFKIGASHKILFVFPMPTQSHNIAATRLYTELAKAGHELTVLTTYPQDKPIDNVKQISMAHLHELFAGTKSELYNFESRSPLDMGKMVMNLNVALAEGLLKHQDVQNLIHSNEKFDLVFIYQYLNDALMGLGHHFKAPVIYFSSMPLYTPESFSLAHPTSSSYTPNILTPYTGHMDFFQRLWNSYYDLGMILYYSWCTLPQHRALVKKYIPGEPDLYDFVNNVSLIFINTHASTNEAIPTAPNAIEIGGFHIQEPKKLPQDIQTFLDNSKDGAILFSMGSILKSADLPSHKVNEILRVFSKLKQNVLWKWEEDNFPNKPKNVKILKWVPQSDILAHPNIKAFISHGGLLSTMESVYHGVPIVGIPIFADQKMNVVTGEANGYMIKIPFQELNEEKLSNALNEILNNSSYRSIVQTRSKILRDRPIQPIQSLHYWVNYVVRHQGAPHLRYPGMDLTWYQRNLLDVAAVVLLITLSLCLLLVYSLKAIAKKFFCKCKKEHKKKE